MGGIIATFNRETEKRNISVRSEMKSFSTVVEIFMHFDELLLTYFGYGYFFLTEEERNSLEKRDLGRFGYIGERFKIGFDRVDKALLREKLKNI